MYACHINFTRVFMMEHLSHDHGVKNFDFKIMLSHEINLTKYVDILKWFPLW